MTIFTRKKKRKLHLTSGDARAYQFIHQFKAIADQTFTGELIEVTRALNCQKSIFIIKKKRLQQSCRKLFIIVCPNLKRT